MTVSGEIVAYLSRYFQVRTDLLLGPFQIPVWAEAGAEWRYHILSKQIVLDRAQTKDIVALFFDTEPSDEWLQRFVNEVQHHLRKQIDQTPRHWRTRFLGVFLSAQSTRDPALLRRLARASFTKSVRLGLKGWYEILLAWKGPGPENLIMPRRGREFVPLIQQLPV